VSSFWRLADASLALLLRLERDYTTIWCMYLLANVRLDPLNAHEAASGARLERGPTAQG
jgi:hypothetical protein